MVGAHLLVLKTKLLKSKPLKTTKRPEPDLTGNDQIFMEPGMIKFGWVMLSSLNIDTT